MMERKLKLFIPRRKKNVLLLGLVLSGCLLTLSLRRTSYKEQLSERLETSDNLDLPGFEPHPQTNVSRDTSSHTWLSIHPMDYVLPPPGHLCIDHPQIVILVTSSPDNALHRVAIRNTWGSVGRHVNKTHFKYITENIALGFVLGQTKNQTVSRNIEEESRTWGDIIQGDFSDTYLNLTLKTIIALKFKTEFCATSKYFIKADDDIFLNIFNLLPKLHSKVSNAMFGMCFYNATVRREGKWAISRADYEADTFMTYMSGPLYAMTYDVTGKLYPHVLLKAGFVHEDIFITGMLAKELGVEKDCSWNYDYRNPREAILKKGFVIARALAYHRVSPANQHAIWTKLSGILY